jgi:formylglycine-generating enzyme required for sulfatase activity
VISIPFKSLFIRTLVVIALSTFFVSLFYSLDLHAEQGSAKNSNTLFMRVASVMNNQTYTNSIGMKFVLIPAGTFIMGSPPSENGRYNNEGQHTVTLTRSFYIQITEVTQDQWKDVMGDNPSCFRKCVDECPVECVSHGDAQLFIKMLNKKEGTDRYRLPYEAEWEYACRAGSKTAFANCDISEINSDKDRSLDAMGWYYGNSGEKTHPVALKKPNSWGLYDMHGNVWEWCLDWYEKYPSEHIIDPKGPPSGSSRVFRGGSWINLARNCRSASRHRRYPDSRFNYIGFRLACTSNN